MSARCPIAHWARLTPQRTALFASGRRWSYAALDAEVRGWTELLLARGVRRGARVAALSRNHPALIAAFFACGRIGASWAPFNARLTAAEVAPLAERVRPELWIVEPELAAQLPEDAPAVPTTIGVGRPPRPRRVRGLEAAVGPRPSAAAARGIRAILFTSGTTGVPRAVQLSAANFEAAARASASNLGGGPDQVWLAALPLFHVGGLTMAHRCARYGATLVLHERFDAAAVWAAILQHGVTHLSVVATGLRWLLEAADHPAPGSLRAVLVGGGATPPALLQLARSRGLPVLQTYGLTESCAQVATERPHEADGESCGPALSGNQLRVEAGELWVRGPSVMVGYLGEPPLGGGWLRTGDLGALDDRGRLRVFSRRTDLIVTGGENVYPAEVEAVLASHPGVAEAAVVGLEDATWGQLPAALLVPRQGESVAELEAWCRARLAGFKVPRRFQLVAELPKTGAGKVDRTRARALAQAERAREDEDEGGARRGRPTAGVDEALDWRTQ